MVHVKQICNSFLCFCAVKKKNSVYNTDLYGLCSNQSLKKAQRLWHAWAALNGPQQSAR